MRVTLVTETYFPQVNGVSRTLGQLVRALTRMGDLVQVVHPDYGEPPENDRICLVRSTPIPFYPELRLPLPPFGETCRAITDFAPDLIHIATEATLGHAALRRALDQNIPVVSSFHTNFDQYADHYGVGWIKGAIWRYLRWFHNATRETYVPSRATIADLEAKGLQRLTLWPRGVDGSLFRPDRPGRAELRRSLGFEPDDVVILHVSRIAAEKNVAYLGEALKGVASAKSNVRLLIVGDGPARRDLELTLGDAARFVGYRTGDDLADHYSAADVFAFASLTETFGNVILEAMASGLPVVAVRSGGPGEIIRPGETGFLVEPTAPASEFAELLIGLVDDTGRRTTMSRAARDYALSQTWDAIMGDLRERYCRIVEEASTAMR
jgi:glycosyltransferase involved in cell wall biosynthesis